MKNKIKYPINIVIRQTGLTAHQIRSWERRYGAVLPERTNTNRRLYTEADIMRLRLMAKAQKAGHSLAQVAELSTEDLMRLINKDASTSFKRSSSLQGTSGKVSHFYSAMLTAAVNMDVAGLERTLQEAAIELTRLELLNGIISPLAVKLYELRQSGRIGAINELMGSNMIRSFLLNMLRTTKISALSPKIVVTTPPGQSYEIGALVIALLASESGWQAKYFGPGLSAEEAAAAVAFTKARAVALYIHPQADSYWPRTELVSLRRFLSDETTILIGGQVDMDIADLFDNSGVFLIREGHSFRETLEVLLAS